MSFCHSGIASHIESTEISVFVSQHHPLIKLANAIPWGEVCIIVAKDLIFSTSRLRWFLGRKLKLRIHLGVYFLQVLTDKDYREIERDLRDNAIYQVFCGRTVVDNWHVPDHTRIWAFQERISPEAKEKLSNFITTLGQKYGYLDPESMDIDSTIQEANIRKPSEVYLLERLSKYAYKAKEGIREELPHLFELVNVPFDLCFVKWMAKYYFLYGKGEVEIKADMLKRMKKEVMPLIYMISLFVRFLHPRYPEKISSRLKYYIAKIQQNLVPLLQNINHFIKNRYGEKDRILSLHLKQVTTFVKGHSGRLKIKYGRQYQVGRLGGNYLLVYGKENKARVEDKESLEPMIELHQRLFGYGTLKSFGTDRGYYSSKNLKYLKDHQQEVVQDGLNFEFHLPKPRVPFWEISEQDQHISNRRSGVEALIGQAKAGGQLGRSRAKTDRGTLSSGYESILGFNLRQLMRHLSLDPKYPRV